MSNSPDNRLHVLSLDSGETFRVSPGGQVLSIHFNGERTNAVIRVNRRDSMTVRDFVLRHGVMILPTNPDRQSGPDRTRGKK